jgi:hypothetical protein
VTAKPVNLNRFRKDKARRERRAEAEANAVKHGRTGAEKARDRREADRAARRLDGAKREE